MRDFTGSERFLAIMRSSVLSASYGTRRRIKGSFKNGCGHVLSITYSLNFATQGLRPFFLNSSNTLPRTVGSGENHCA